MLRLVDTPFSYSVLDNFETCEYNYQATRWNKTHVEAHTRQKGLGLDVHTAMQRYVERGEAPPLGLVKFRRIVDTVTEGASDVVCEIKFGLRSDLSPCQFFDKDVCLRVQFDLNALRRDSIAQLDYKTSSQPRESELQLKLYGMAGLMRWPQFQECWSAFIYTHHPSRRVRTTRDEIPDIVAALNPRLERLKAARESDSWVKRSSWKCGYCPVSECEFYNPRR